MEPYEAGIAKGRSRSIKTSVRGHIVVVLDTRRENRQLELIHPYSRCVTASEVHELVLTDEQNAKPGSKVQRVAGIGFMVFSQSGVVMVGDRFMSPGLGPLGTVVGFDVSHYPNHFNVVLYNDSWLTGREMGLYLNSEVLFSGESIWPAVTEDE